MASTVPPYDPSKLVRIIETTMKEEPGIDLLLAKLRTCTQPLKYCSCGCGSPYFLDPEGPAWRFGSCLEVWHEGGLYVVDVMQDLSIGSIEIVEKCAGGSTRKKHARPLS